LSSDADNSDIPSIFSVENIMQRVREHASEQDVAIFRDEEAARHLSTLRAHADVYHANMASTRRVLAPLLRIAKRIGRWALQPSLARQVRYNTANALVAQTLRDQCEVLLRRQDAAALAQTDAVREIRDQLAGLEERVGGLLERAGQIAMLAEQQRGLTGDLQSTHALVQAVRSDVETLSNTFRERVGPVERRLRRVVHTLANGLADHGSAPVELPAAMPEADFDNLGFADRFRGSEEEIKDRQRPYLEYFAGRDRVLDIGCGRGEFLELLREAGVGAQGVDRDLDMLLWCKEKGLDVVRADAMAFLDGLPDGSLGGIFCAQVVEHLDGDRIVQLVQICGRKLSPGACLIIETVNPGCLLTFAESFYLDLSHIRPIHSQAMRFVLESAGFGDLQTLFSSPVDPALRIPTHPESGPQFETFNAGIARLNDLIYGFQDYAIVGRAGFSAGAFEGPQASIPEEHA
jgi:SAM-dependent methyltransferase